MAGQHRPMNQFERMLSDRWQSVFKLIALLLMSLIFGVDHFHTASLFVLATVIHIELGCSCNAQTW